MTIPTPSFIPALVALPFIAATFLVALRAPAPNRNRPGLIVSSLSLGLLLFAASYPLFANFGPFAALAAILAGCLSMHLAMWLGRADDGESISAIEDEPTDPDLLDFDDIDWGGFDRARRNWADSKTTLPLV